MAQPEAHVVHYEDPVIGIRGFLAFAGDRHRLAAGGLRVRADLTADTIAALAQTMVLKQRLLGLGVDGAKAGLDLDPSHPRKAEVLRRFLRFLRPYLRERLSLGPDMGTTWEELEALAAAEGPISVKGAIAPAQGLDPADFGARLRLLGENVGGQTLAQRRAGHAVAHAALAVARSNSSPVPRVALQGFGTLGRGAALSLAEAGARLTAVADEHGCLVDVQGLDVARLLRLPHGHLGGAGHGRTTLPTRDVVLEAPVDVLVLAACEDAVSPEQATNLQADSVVVGANLGLSPSVESLLDRLGVTVVPDFVAGCGGSASMDALFGPATCPGPHDVLQQVGATMNQVVDRMLARVACDGVSPRAAALALCETAVLPCARPYGRRSPGWPFRSGATAQTDSE